MRSSPQHCAGWSGSGKLLTWILCLVLGAALRGAYGLRTENPRLLVRMIRALNNISLKEGHNEVVFFISETGRLRGRYDNCAHICEHLMSMVGGAKSSEVQQGRFKFDIRKKFLMASIWKYWRSCLHH